MSNTILSHLLLLGLLMGCTPTAEPPLPTRHDLFALDPSTSHAATDTFSMVFIEQYANAVLAAEAPFVIDVYNLTAAVPEPASLGIPAAPSVPDLSPRKPELLAKRAAHHDHYYPLLVEFLRQHLTAVAPVQDNYTFLNRHFRLIADQLRADPSRQYRMITTTDFLNETKEEGKDLMDIHLLHDLATDTSLQLRLYLLNNTVDYHSLPALHPLRPYRLFKESDFFHHTVLTSNQ